MFLSLTDYVQHKYAPNGRRAASTQDLDQRFGRLEALGAWSRSPPITA
jgi:hypothetical protein